MSYTFKPIADPESLSLLRAAGLLWYRNNYAPEYWLLPARDTDYKEWWEWWVADGATLSEDGKFCWSSGWWEQCAIRVEGDSPTSEREN